MEKKEETVLFWHMEGKFRIAIVQQVPKVIRNFLLEIITKRVNLHHLLVPLHSLLLKTEKNQLQLLRQIIQALLTQHRILGSIVVL
jgi:hypothetical protein